MSNVIALAKIVSDVAVSAGVGAIVGNTVKLSTPANAKVIQKITIAVGSLALSGMAGQVVAAYTSKEIDAVVTQVQALKPLFKKN